jgi:hypothetical protein
VVLAPQSEADKVEAWRMEQLLIAGYPVLLAVLIADSDVDLHRAIEMLKRGCSPQLAYEILL